MSENDEAAKWRIRVTKRNEIFSELIKIGSCPALMCSSVLVLPRGGHVDKLESFSHWRETLEQSPMFNTLDKHQQGRLRRLGFEPYSRLEDGLNCLGRVLCLACEEQSDRMMLESLAELKIWAMKLTLKERSADSALAYLKWVAKAAQACFLNTSIPELPAARPGKFLGQVLPFAGPLRFITDLILGRRDRAAGITLEEGRAIAQVASLGRALPYPSKDQVKASVKDVIELTKEAPSEIPSVVAERYKEGLRFIATRIKGKISTQTHCSLAASGSLESSRSAGGRGADLVRLAKPACNLILTEELINMIVDKRDVFGFVPMSLLMAHVVRDKMSQNPEKVPRLGHFLYRQAVDIEEIWENCDSTSKPPKELPKIFNLVCSDDLLSHGHYTGSYESIHGMLLFGAERKQIVFVPNCTHLPVKADVSVEAGMKTRLTTSAMTSYVHFGQQVGHVLRAYLRDDPFLQVGFEEPDKLWEVLKQYRKSVFKTDVKMV